MNITGMGRKECVYPRPFSSVHGLRVQANTKDKVERPLKFSKPYGSFVSSSSQFPLFNRSRHPRRSTEQSQRIEGIVGNVRKVVGEIRNV